MVDYWSIISTRKKVGKLGDGESSFSAVWWKIDRNWWFGIWWIWFWIEMSEVKTQKRLDLEIPEIYIHGNISNSKLSQNSKQVTEMFSTVVYCRLWIFADQRTPQKNRSLEFWSNFPTPCLQRGSKDHPLPLFQGPEQEEVPYTVASGKMLVFSIKCKFVSFDTTAAKQNLANLLIWHELHYFTPGGSGFGLTLPQVLNCM